MVSAAAEPDAQANMPVAKSVATNLALLCIIIGTSRLGGHEFLRGAATVSMQFRHFAYLGILRYEARGTRAVRDDSFHDPSIQKRPDGHNSPDQTNGLC